MRDARIVCILGPHRSGTSLITRVLNLMGLYLGPEDNMRKPRKWNPRGYWEHQPIIDINDAILARFEGSWHEPPCFPSGWERSSELEDLRQTARNYLHQNFSNASSWGWKEPRTCLTLPFWKQFLPSLSYLICLRSPVEVAQSLRRRNRYSMQKGIHLWMVYLEHALENSDPDRGFIFYEDFMSDWRAHLPFLSTFLGQSQPVRHAGIETAIGEFIDPTLRHHDYSSENAFENADRNESVIMSHRLYRDLRKNAKNNPGQIAAALQETIKMIKPQLEYERPW